LITKHLAHIAKLENVKIDAGALDAIARGAEGGMRDAESTLDQLISFCGDKIEESDVLSMFGLTARGQILALAKALVAGQADVALRELNDLSKNGKDLGRLISDLLSHFRNLLIYQVAKGDLSLLEVSEAEAASLAEQGAGVSADALTRIMEVLSDCEMRLRDAASKKILVEVALLKAIEARNAMSIDNVLQQLQQLRNGGGVASAPVQVAAQPVRVLTAAPVVAATPVAPVKPRVSAEPVKAAAPVAPAPAPARLAETAPVPASVAAPVGDVNLEELWSKLVEAVGKASPFAKSYFLEAHPVSMSKNTFTIGFDPEFADHIGFVDNAKNHALVQTKLSEFGYPGMQVKFVKAERPAGWALKPVETAPEPIAAPTPAAPKPAAAKASAASAPAAPQPPKEKPAPMVFNKDDFKNDPLIKKALEVFKGTIVEVRA
jgi:DNA polymerase III subunit gamma/tau